MGRWLCLLCCVGAGVSNVVGWVAADANPPVGDASILYNPRARFIIVCPRPTTRTLNATEAAGIRPGAGRARVGGAGICFDVTGEYKYQGEERR